VKRPAALLALVASAAAASARADEGMWMPQQLPALAPRLEALGFQGEAKAFADLTGQPMGAIVSLGGCSASFVSPDGLVATNHHCALGALQFNATPLWNLLHDGFVARAREEELWAGPGQHVYVTVSVKDVTQEIVGKLSPKLSDLDRELAIERRQKERLAACEQGGLRCTVAFFFRGMTWLEIAQLDLQDVRLVFAPPGNVGNFGGETDNWMWPRHSGDFAFYRAYVRPDGKPGPHAKENVPYRPARWLPVSPAGASPGDLVFVAGYPGRTQRLATWAETKEQIGWAYPWTQRRYKEQLALLQAVAKAAPESAILVNSKIRALANTMKNREGVLAGAARIGLLDAKRRDEEALRAWIAAEPKRAAAYGQAVPALDAILAAREKTRERDATFEGLYGYQTLLASARTILRLAEERGKKDLDRDLEYQARNWSRIRDAQDRLQRSLDVAADRALLRYAVMEATKLPAGQRVEPLDRLLGVGPGAAAEDVRLRVDAWLDRVYGGTRLGDRAFRLSLLDRDAKALAMEKDAMLEVAAALAPMDARLRAEEKARAGARSRVGPAYARALVERAGGVLAPDANSTLRVTFGKVEGLSPRDGVVYAPQTRLAGILAKDRPGDPEFDVPQPLRDAIRAREGRGAGPYADPKLGDVPVDFLATLDITGGNSGSAVLDAKGRLCGLAFDGLYEYITSDFAYSDAGRTIAVDSRYLLWFLGEVARAPNLLAELGVAPPRAER
jgi:hypothetical protein